MQNTFKLLITTTLLILAFSGCKPITISENKELNMNTENTITDFDDQIEGKYWKLIAIEGQPVTMADDQKREVHLKLSNDGNKVSGFAGCNSFFGTYKLNEDALKIKFSSLATTMMACEGMNDRKLLDVLELTDNYTTSSDRLFLNIGRHAPLAEFQAIYFNK